MNWEQIIADTECENSAEQPVLEFPETVATGLLHTVGWQDLIVEATTLPHLKDAARRFIERNLGYLPPEEVMLPFEPYLRALLQFYFQSAVDFDSFMDQAGDHLKLIRNADMKHNTCPGYDEAIYRNYTQSYIPYGYIVKERLTRFLGYEPLLEHSLIAELWLRDILADDSYKIPEEITQDDYRAITLIKYREVLLSSGQQAADASSLLPEWFIMHTES